MHIKNGKTTGQKQWIPLYKKWNTNTVAVGEMCIVDVNHFWKFYLLNYEYYIQSPGATSTESSYEYKISELRVTNES